MPTTQHFAYSRYSVGIVQSMPMTYPSPVGQYLTPYRLKDYRRRRRPSPKAADAESGLRRTDAGCRRKV
jgi:hypothetical protein